MEKTFNSKSGGNTYSLVLIALFAALTAVFSQISVPIGPVPINLGLLSVFTAGGLLGIKRAVMSQVLYVLLGAAGVPVFAGFKGGFAALSGPTGGYIIGYILAAGTVAVLCRFWKKRAAALITGMLIGLILCYAFGTVWFIILTQTDFASALSSCVLPFLPGDAVKIAAATTICLRLGKMFKAK